MNEESLKTLTGMLSDIGGKQDDIKASMEENREKLAKLEEKFGKHDEILSNLEKQGMPTTRQPQELNINTGNPAGPTKVLFGYNLDLQGSELAKAYERDTWEDRPKLKGYTMIADPAKRERYAQYMITMLRALKGDFKAMGKLQEMQAKANELTEGTTTNVGYLVPDEYADEILAFARLSSVALQDCRIMPMGTDVKRIPAENTNVSVTWTAETIGLTQKYPAITEVVLTAKKVGGYCIVTNELLADTAHDVVSWLTGQFAEALGQEIDNQVFAGTGSPCSGITTGICGYSVLTSGSISTVTGTDLSSMIAKLSPNKRTGAKFYFEKSVFHHIRTLKDSQNAFIYNPIGGVQANTIWGYPVTECEKVPSTDGTKKPFGLLGNLNNFIIGRRLQNTTMDVDPYSAFTSDMTNFRIYWRLGLAVGLAKGFCRIMTA